MILLAALLLTPAEACERPPREIPGLRLAARLETHLERVKKSLAGDLSHLGLVFPVGQEELLAFMRQIRVFGDGKSLVLGTAYGFESHGGGLLALLMAHWRPGGRAAELGDHFVFESSGASIPLSAIYQSHRNQIFLPDPENPPKLPRMLFRLPGGPGVEADAYQFLGLLIERETDLEKSWLNGQGQRPSVSLLLDQARRYYLQSRDSAAEPEDHSNLHLVEVLLAASRRQGGSPEEIQQHFLEVELQRRAFDPEDEALLLGHYAESLGRLVADPRVRWSAREKAQARDWLAWLEQGRFRELDHVAPRHLTHLLLGLRLVREHRARLE